MLHSKYTISITYHTVAPAQSNSLTRDGVGTNQVRQGPARLRVRSEGGPRAHRCSGARPDSCAILGGMSKYGAAAGVLSEPDPHLQEWWGITDEIKVQALELSKQGGCAATFVHLRNLYLSEWSSILHCPCTIVLLIR